MANSSPPKRATVSAGRDMRPHPVPHGGEDLVAELVAVGVVDHLEPVEPDEQHAHDAPRCPPRQGEAEPIEEQGPVRAAR